MVETTPRQAYFGLGKLDFGLGKLDFGLGNPILDWQPNLGLATQSWTGNPILDWQPNLGLGNPILD